MGEITLSDGKVVTIDTGKITHGEWRRFFSGKGTVKQDDEFVQKATGLNVAEQEALLHDDFRRIMQAILKAGNQPLTDPNLPSAST